MLLAAPPQQQRSVPVEKIALTRPVVIAVARPIDRLALFLASSEMVITRFTLVVDSIGHIVGPRRVTVTSWEKIPSPAPAPHRAFKRYDDGYRGPLGYRCHDSPLSRSLSAAIKKRDPFSENNEHDRAIVGTYPVRQQQRAP